MNRPALLPLLRRIRPESAARMRRRLRTGAFLRGIFWQGDHAAERGHDKAGMDPALLKHYEDEITLTYKSQGYRYQAR